ncbi:MAG: hypothetical protein F8N37_23920 [Telmatospirillum sp.]|nr:hypothetical protein [Telmatospirillum sp.]
MMTNTKASSRLATLCAATLVVVGSITAAVAGTPSTGLQTDRILTGVSLPGTVQSAPCAQERQVGPLGY